MRDRSDDVHPHFRRRAQQGATVREGLDAFLREGDQLKSDGVSELFAKLQQSTQRREIRIGHVDVYTSVLHAESGLLRDCAPGPSLDVAHTQFRLAFTPRHVSLEQGSRLVPPGLTRRQRRIK